MNRLCKLLSYALGVCLMAASLLHAQAPTVANAAKVTPTASELPGVDFSGLSAAQKQSALKLMREHGCGCGCGMKIAECRVKDQGCSYSRGLASVIVEELKNGKSETEAIKAAEASRWAHPAPQDTRILSDAVAIPTTGAPRLGSPNAKIMLVEFSDFQCPFCILAVPQLKALLQAFPQDVVLVFKQFPLDSHSEAALASAAALAAHKQGKFWAMHDALFAQKGRLSRPLILKLASKIGLDASRFEKEMDAPETRKAVENDAADGERAGVAGTPTIFINGQRFNGAVKTEVLKPLLEAELKHPAKASISATALKAR